MQISHIISICIVVILIPVLASVITFVSILFPSTYDSQYTPKDFGFEYENISLHTQDGVQLDSWLVTEDQADNSKTDRLIIIMHGYPAEKGDVLSSTIHLAKNFDLLYFDFRALGESGGRYATAGINERHDLQAALQFAQENGYESVGLWGFSVGGAVALMEAPEHDIVNATVAVSPYARLSQLGKNLYAIPILDTVMAQLLRGWAYMWFGTDIVNIAPADAMIDYTKPVFIIHPRGDATVPHSHAIRLQRALSENTRTQFWFPDGNHGLFPQEKHNKKISNFFINNL